MLRFALVTVAFVLMCASATQIFKNVLLAKHLNYKVLQAEQNKKLVEPVDTPEILAVTVQDIVPKQTTQKILTVTAYNSVPEQTDDTPFIAAWMDKLEPGMRIVAVSRDLEKEGLTRGSKIYIEGLGEFEVLDRMNKRWKNRVDIWMEEDTSKARKFGKKELLVTWVVSENKKEEKY